MDKLPVYKHEKTDNPLDPANLLPFTKDIGKNPLGHAIDGFRIDNEPYAGYVAHWPKPRQRI